MGKAAALNEWIVSLNPQPEATRRLFVFPYAGGAPAAFMDWPRHFPPDVEILAIYLPGRGSRFTQSPLRQVARISDQLAVEISPHLTARSFFFGHSLGALIAFETLRRLRTRSLSVVNLQVSAHPAPRLKSRRRPIHRLPDEEFIDEVRDLSGTPPEVLESRELLEVILPSLRADFEAAETYAYTPGDPLPCPIYAYGGETDPWADASELATWKEETVSRFDLTVYPGDHFYLNGQREHLLKAVSRRMVEN